MSLRSSGSLVRRASFLGLVSLLSLPALGNGQQGDWEEQVDLQLEAAAEALVEEGFEPFYEIVTGALEEGDSDGVELNLDPAEYAVLGVCDTDCSELGLVLYDEDGDAILETSGDDAPVMVGDVAVDGTYYVQVAMLACASEPCYWGIGLYRR